MRALIVTGIFPPDIGGPATYVPTIADALAERGHEVVVVTLSDGPDQDDPRYRFRVVRLPRKLPKPWRVLRTIWTIWGLGKDADVLFVNGLALESVLANFVLRKPLVMKVVGDLAWERATNWGWTVDDFETFQKRRYGLWMELLKASRSWWTRRADQVIVPSRYLAHWVARWGVPEERIEVIYNALKPIDGVAPVSVPLQTPVKAVTVGRLVPWKRIDLILGAMASMPELGLVIVGEGPERPRLKQLVASLGVTDRVCFAGACPRDETLALMAGCDFFVLNSTYEGLPHVVLEAMALGLPVVATAVGGTPEVVRDGETGVLLPTDVMVLGDALRHLAEEPDLRQRLGRAARQWACENFRQERMVAETEAILMQVLRSPI
jgi:glycosyltransferase involved in cell wall biosynthesis